VFSDTPTYEASYLAAVAGQLSHVPSDRRDLFVAYAQGLQERRVPVLFSVAHLAHAVGLPGDELGLIISRLDLHYSAFRVRKRRGGSRLIEAPSVQLKHIQRWIQSNVTALLPSSAAAHGFRPGRSIKTNAEPHVGTELLVQYDIRDFFGSITTSDVMRAFRLLGYSTGVSRALTALTTFRGALPQGAPTSPDLANFAARTLDARLSGLSEKNGAAYTRYADDLTFSSGGASDPRFRRAVEFIIRDSGFTPHDDKTRYTSQATQQRVTGVVVNEKLNWPRDTRRWLRQEVHYLERFGVDHHLARRRSNRGRYKEYIYGHVLALNSVRPDLGGELLGRLDRIEWPY
jgi:RNA-directed DNA polymerase